MQLAPAELERRLRLGTPEIAAELLRQLTAVRPARARLLGRGAAIACPACSRAMQPVAVGGGRGGWCADDDQLWLDASQLAQIDERAGAHHARGRSWLARLRAFLYAS